MRKAVIEDSDQFYAFLATQPLCKWSAKKKHEIATGMLDGKSSAQSSKSKSSNAELAAAIAAMA